MSGSIHHQANLVLRFVLELCALAALFYWGWWSGEGTFAGLALGLGAVLLAAVFWGLFAAPRARVRVPLSGRLAVELAFFGSAATGLYATGHSAPAALLFGLAVCNRALIQAWRQEESMRTDA